jgi:hypothetical protein
MHRPATIENFPPATAEQTAEAVFERNKSLIETMEPIEELEAKFDDALADEHDMMEKKYAALDRRLRKVELRGALLPHANEENILFWLGVAFFTIEFVIPAVMRLIDKAEKAQE